MSKYNTVKIGKNIAITFDNLTNWEIAKLIEACQRELNYREESNA